MAARPRRRPRTRARACSSCAERPCAAERRGAACGAGRRRRARRPALRDRAVLPSAETRITSGVRAALPRPRESLSSPWSTPSRAPSRGCTLPSCPRRWPATPRQAPLLGAAWRCLQRSERGACWLRWQSTRRSSWPPRRRRVAHRRRTTSSRAANRRRHGAPFPPPPLALLAVTSARCPFFRPPRPLPFLPPPSGSSLCALRSSFVSFPPRSAVRSEAVINRPRCSLPLFFCLFFCSFLRWRSRARVVSCPCDSRC